MSVNVTHTRTEAAAAGLRKYWSGKPCGRGHNALRYVASGTCVKCSHDNQAKFSRGRAPGMSAHTFMMHNEDVPAVAELVDALNAARKITP